MNGQIARNEDLTVDEYMASVGVDMLHPGGMRRTEEIAEMCEISKGDLVLDVGCGYGRTAHYLVAKHGCRVTGIDISSKMVWGAVDRDRKDRVRGLVCFQMADAMNMPFRDESFDVVISEGTTVLVDKEKALDEYVRVTKHGGFVGLNELSWRGKPSMQMVERTLADLQGVSPLEYDEWTRLLNDHGLRDIQSRAYKYESTSWDIISSLGLRALIRVGIVYLTNPQIREWVNRQENLFDEYSSYWGYGLYSGRKP
jgi:ubiquinone/menaquinone biosynthesis C-methylase UbiE